MISGEICVFLKNFEWKKMKNDHNALIDVKMNKNIDVKIQGMLTLFKVLRLFQTLE